MSCRVIKEVWLGPCTVRAPCRVQNQKKKKTTPLIFFKKPKKGREGICAPRAKHGIVPNYKFHSMSITNIFHLSNLMPYLHQIFAQILNIFCIVLCAVETFCQCSFVRQILLSFEFIDVVILVFYSLRFGFFPQGEGGGKALTFDIENKDNRSSAL